jgi:hypothetical protein
MFDQPSRNNYTPPGTIDIEERYLFKLARLTDEGVSKFADPAKGEKFHNIAWHMDVAIASSRVRVYDNDGNPWEYVENTTSKTGKNPKNGMVAKARLYIEAFLGHSVEDDEISADLPQQLVGRYASGFFEFADREAQDGTKYQRLQIMRLSPYKGPQVAEPQPVAAAPPKSPTPAETGAAAQELPF